MNIKEAEDLFTDIAAELALPTGWELEWDNSKKRFGQCRYRTMRIGLSWQLVTLNTKERVENTIRHEIAHALTPGHGHDAVWVAMAKKCGCDGARCYNSNASAPELGEVVAVSSPYEFYHAACGKRIPRHKRLPAGRKVSCPKCNPHRFDEQFVMEFRRTA